MYTVYFDTSFFINLRDANEDEAASAIQSLNHYMVRHVLSDVIFRELITSGAPQDAQIRLVRRVLQFECTPLVLGPADWLAFLDSEAERRQAAEAYQTIDKYIGAGTSLVVTAGRGIDQEQLDKIIRADPKIFESMGWLSDDGSIDQSAMTEWGRKMLIDRLGIDPEHCDPREIIDKVDQALRKKFGDALVDTMHEHSRLTESVLESSIKPVQHASGELSCAAEKELLTTYRDTEHMALFVQNISKIDLLQIDKKQMNIARTNPMHRLQALGLLDRCFVAGSLSEAVSEVGKKWSSD